MHLLYPADTTTTYIYYYNASASSLIHLTSASVPGTLQGQKDEEEEE